MAIITAQAPLPQSAPTSAVEPAIQPSTIETPVEETKQDALSPKYAALARQEKAMRGRAQQLKAREDAIKAKEAEYSTSYVSKSDLAKRISENPLAVMGEYGLTAEQLTQLALNPPAPESLEIQKLKAKFEALEGKQSETLTNLEKQQQQAYDQAVNQIRNDAKFLIDADENFETIKETNSVEAVVELIKETFDQTGDILSVQEAAKEVENYLIEEALKMARLKKVAEKLAPPIESKQQLIPKQNQPLRTLTHTVSASTKPLSSKDRVQRAILAFKGELK